MSENKASLALENIRPEEYEKLQVIAYGNDIARLHKSLDAFVNVRCPACNMDDAVFKFEKYKCKFVECNLCTATYMNPRPTNEIMNEYYSNSENYAFWNKYIFPRSEVHRREKICRPNLTYITEACLANGLNKPILLEVGPGFGTFAHLAKESMFFESVNVVERTPEMIEACKAKGLKVINSTLEDLVGWGNSADIVVCFEVIEHIFSPEFFLNNINCILKNNGLFVFTCPNSMGFDTLMLGAASPAVDTEHVNLFNPKSISKLLKRCGFEIISIDTPGKLDVELVRKGILKNEIRINEDQFLQKVLIEDFNEIGSSFQNFLSDNKLSGSMRVLARKGKGL